MKAIVLDGSWRYAVTIQHDGFTSASWHVEPIVGLGVGDPVSRGQKIATIADLGSNTHFHLGIRNGTYSNTANRGALPTTDCGDDPAYPEDFVDPALLTYYDRPDFAVQLISQNMSVTPWLLPNATTGLSVTYRNVGAWTWNNNGGVTDPHYVELRSVDGSPQCGQEESSCAYDPPPSWTNRIRIGSFDGSPGSTVPTNQTATFSFFARAGLASGECVQWVAPVAPFYGGCIQGWGGVNFTVRVDGNPPGIPVVSGVSPSGWSNVNNFTVTWTNPGDAHSGINRYQRRLGTGDPDDTAANSVTYVDVLPGSHSFEVRAIDNAGNVGLWSSSLPGGYSYIYYDPIAPDPPAVIDVTPPGWSNVNNFTATWTNPGDAHSGINHYQRRLDTGNPDDTAANSVTYVNLSPGRHSFEVRAIDNVGNVGLWSSSLPGGYSYIYYDPEPPGTPVVTATSSTCANSDTFSFSWTNPGDAHSGINRYQRRVDGGPPDDTAANAVTLVQVSPGQHTIEVRAVDNAGNLGTWSTPVTFYYDSVGCAVGPNLSFDSASPCTPGVPCNWMVVSQDGGTFSYQSGGVSGTSYVAFNHIDANAWNAIGHNYQGLLFPGVWHRLVFWYRTNTTTAVFRWSLGDAALSAHASPLVGVPSINPEGDGIWRLYHGAPFRLTQAQLDYEPMLTLYMDRGAIGTLDVDGVRLEPVAPDQVADGGFEYDPDGNGQPDLWTFVALNGGGISGTAPSPYEGSRALRLVHTDADDWTAVGEYVNRVLLPDSAYRLVFQYRVSDPSVVFRWALGDPELATHSSAVVGVPRGGSPPLEADGAWHEYRGAPFRLQQTQLDYEPMLTLYMDYGTVGTLDIDAVRLEKLNPTDANEAQGTLPSTWALQASPNPCSKQVSFDVRVPIRASLRGTLFDVKGRRVQQFLDREVPAGVFRYSLGLDGTVNGVYFIHLEVPGVAVLTRRLIVMK